MPGQMGILQHGDGTFSVLCKVCPSEKSPTIIAADLADRSSAEVVVTEHKAEMHRFGGVVSLASV